MNHKSILISLFLSILTTLTVAQKQPQITFNTLLRDIVDRNKLAEYPHSNYKTLQASSYNRASVSPDEPGWFADSDGVFCIRTEENNGKKEWVLMEDYGPGAITKMWAVCFYYGLDNTTGANLKIYLDGETEPTINTNFFQFVMGRDFVKPPLASETRRAGNSYLPIPYAKSCKVTMDSKVFYNIINYHSYPKGTAVETFNMDIYNQSKLLVDSVNTVLAQGAFSTLVDKTKRIVKKEHNLKPGESFKVKLPKGNHAISQLKIKIDAKDAAQALRSTILKASFDGEQTIWSPVGDFFSIGVGKKAYTMWERAVSKEGEMICRWVMPYQNQGIISFENLGKESVSVEVSVDTEKREWSNQSMYFHSSWRMDEPTPGFPLFDYNLIEVDGTGVYIGDQFTVLNPTEGWWGEGDEKVYVDNDFSKGFPSHFGTGTEDYYGWAGGVVPNPVDEFDEPFLSNVLVAGPNSMGYNTCTRTRVLDAIPFERKLKFDIESSGSTRLSWFHLQYAVNTYWYALPGAKHNRKPLPEIAAQKIKTLAELQCFNEKMKSDKYLVEGAIEAENLSTYNLSPAVKNHSKMNIWGEMSNGAIKGFEFSQPGQSVTVRLTELFADVNLKICMITNQESGVFDIFVNGKMISTINLNSEHGAVHENDLGRFTPVENALEVKFVFKGCKSDSKNGLLGIDYFKL